MGKIVANRVHPRWTGVIEDPGGSEGLRARRAGTFEIDPR